WCVHSQGSQWVQREATLAVESGKRVIPVLIDRTPLPSHLARFQAIDLAGHIRHEVAKIGLSQMAYLAMFLLILGLALIVLLVFGLSHLIFHARAEDAEIIDALIILSIFLLFHALKELYRKIRPSRRSLRQWAASLAFRHTEGRRLATAVMDEI